MRHGFTLAILTAVLFFSVFRDGGVEPPDWRWCLSAIALSAFFFWFTERPKRNNRSLSLLLLSMAVLLAAVLQVIPLPAPLVAWISPSRATIHEAVQGVAANGSPTLSVVPGASIEKTLTVAAYLLAFFLVRRLRGHFQNHPWLVAAPLIAIGTIEGLLGMAQYYSGAQIAQGTYVNRNHFAGLLAMCFPMAAIYGLSRMRMSHSRYTSPLRPALAASAAWIMATVMLIAIINSESRMGFLATLGASFTMGIVALSSGRRTVLSRWGPALAVALVVVVAFVFLPTDRLITRFADMASSEEVSSDTRTQLWTESIALIRAYPLFGCGLGCYESAFLKYKTVAPLMTADFAHNDYLQVLAELGLAGFLPLIVLTVLIYSIGLKNVSEAPPDRYVALASIGSLTAILLHSFVDFNLYIPANGLVAVWVGGLACPELS